MFLIIIKCLLKVAWSDFGPLYILLNIIFIFVISYLYFSYKPIILKGSSIICNRKIRLFFSKIEIFEVNKYHLCWVSQKKKPTTKQCACVIYGNRLVASPYCLGWLSPKVLHQYHTHARDLWKIAYTGLSFICQHYIVSLT